MQINILILLKQFLLKGVGEYCVHQLVFFQKTVGWQASVAITALWKGEVRSMWMCHMSHMSHLGAYWKNVYVGYLEPTCLQPSGPALFQDGQSESPRDELPGSTTGKMTISCGNDALEETVSLNHVGGSMIMLQNDVWSVLTQMSYLATCSHLQWNNQSFQIYEAVSWSSVNPMGDFFTKPAAELPPC